MHIPHPPKAAQPPQSRRTRGGKVGAPARAIRYAPPLLAAIYSEVMAFPLDLWAPVQAAKSS
jgi:hypothetical protein